MISIHRKGNSSFEYYTDLVASISIASLCKNVEAHSSTILEDEKLNSFLLKRAWQVLQKIRTERTEYSPSLHIVRSFPNSLYHALQHFLLDFFVFCLIL